MLPPNNIEYKKWNFRITKPEELQKIEDLYIKAVLGINQSLLELNYLMNTSR